MKDVVTAGTGTAVNFPGMPIAGKTGTTSNDKDVWFVGYTPYYTAGVWAGYDIPTSKLRNTAERNYHKKLWRSVMSRIHEELPNQDFERPEEIVEVQVCSESGKLPKEGCPVYTEVFTKGTQPTSECDVHQIATICTDTGCIANEFCVNKEIKTYYSLPEKESTNLWSTQYGEQFVELPELCTHKASDFTYND